MPYDTHGDGYRGELGLYCPRAEVKFSKMTSVAQGHKSGMNIKVLCVPGLLFFLRIFNARSFF